MKAKTYSISRVFDINSDTLFQIVSDFNKYPDWNTIIPKGKGEFKVGTKLELMMNMRGKIKPFNPKIISIDQGKGFTLSKTLITKGIGALVHEFKFTALPDNKTEFTQTWTGKGILVKMMWSKIAEGFSDFEIFYDDLENYLVKQK
ncbi:MAG: hypothetical protein JKX73_01100 [Flavobacteriales bacterium]|nr:hypothetical protein [Flavobacteriales bacterium]